MLGTRGIVRGTVVVALLFVALAGAALAGHGPPPPGGPGDPSGEGACFPIASPTTTSQARILARDALRVAVQKSDCVDMKRIKIDALSRIVGADRRAIAKVVSVPADKERRRVSLPLTASGRHRISRCADQKLIVRAKTRDGIGGAGPSFLDLDSDACRDAGATLPAPGNGDGGPPPGGGGNGNGTPPGGGGGGGTPPGGGGGGDGEPVAHDTEDADRCDFLDPAHCLFPWPNDHFTTEDENTDTGRRIDLHPASMPRNKAGVPINPLDYNRNDGFSPGQLIVTKVPGLDNPAAFENTGAVPITDIARSFDPEQPIVVLDADTGERQLIWSEIDANPQDPEDVALLIRPAVNFTEGHRYIVALRNLRDADGDVIPPQDGFQLYRDGTTTTNPAVESRRDHFEDDIFPPLEAAGIERQSLYLAWDFTVASERNLTERALSIRDVAFAQLGDPDLSDLEVPASSSAPRFRVTQVQDFPSGNIQRQVDGEVIVPCYLDAPGCPPGSRFEFGPDPDDPAADPNPLHWNIPERIPGNTTAANFTCRIPRSASAASPARPSLYGHGLLGSSNEVGGGNISAMANEHNMIFCATDWAGFSTLDLGTVLASLQDLSNFPRLVDRMQQGFLNFMYVGRAMVHSAGFGSDPAFQIGGDDAIDERRLFYDGNSQGGIMGGALTALAPDFDRAVLGVPGMNYSTLLRRSSDFGPYAEGMFTGEICGEVPDEFAAACGPVPEDTPLGLYDNYPDMLERPLLLSMIQMVWDRGEANGYANHLTTDPLANTPSHQVLLHPAFGDHQVSMWTAEVEARTIGAATNPNPLLPGRHPDTDPLFGIPRISSFPYAGSALVYWDTGPLRMEGEASRGTPQPPITNTPPHEGNDPHGAPRSDPKARAQKSAFLQLDGQVVDVCGGGPCFAGGYTGTPAP